MPLHPAGETLNNAIWEAAWFAVNERQCSKDEFVALMTKAAAEAFDSQVNNARIRKPDRLAMVSDLLEKPNT